jgi:hypothetical protein
MCERRTVWTGDRGKRIELEFLRGHLRSANVLLLLHAGGWQCACGRRVRNNISSRTMHAKHAHTNVPQNHCCHPTQVARSPTPLWHRFLRQQAPRMCRLTPHQLQGRPPPAPPRSCLHPTQHPAVVHLLQGAVSGLRRCSGAPAHTPGVGRSASKVWRRRRECVVCVCSVCVSVCVWWWWW